MIDTLGGWILDVAALIAVSEATSYAGTVTLAAQERGLTLLAPVTALAEAYHATPSAGARKRLARVRDEQGPWLLAWPQHVPPDVLAALTERAGGDRTAAHVAYLAADRGWPVLTRRPELLTLLVPGLQAIAV